MRAFLSVLLVCVAGCGNGLGSSTPCAAGMEPFPPGTVVSTPRCPAACDPVAARGVVYDEGGAPAYAGQALLNLNCSGSYCHAAEATGDLRRGAPAGLDFVTFAATSASLPLLTDLGRVHRIVAGESDDIWGQVTSGAMPPGEEGREIVAETLPYHWQSATGEELAALETPAGREILRNWLACGAPLVDRTDMTGALTTCPTGVSCAGDYVASVAPAPLP
jgi:hypothetical protein